MCQCLADVAFTILSGFVTGSPRCGSVDIVLASINLPHRCIAVEERAFVEAEKNWVLALFGSAQRASRGGAAHVRSLLNRTAGSDSPSAGLPVQCGQPV